VLPTAVAVDGAGNLFIADFGNGLIRRVSADGTIVSVVGSSNGAPLVNSAGAVSVTLIGPTGLAVDGAGTIYFTQGSVGSGSGLAIGDYRVWSVANGVVTALAGDGFESYAGDGGAAIGAQLEQPASAAVDGAGNLYIADSENHRVRKISPGGTITTVAGTGTPGFSGDGGPAISAELSSPQGVALDGGGNLWIADSGNSRVRRVSPDGSIRTVIGNGNSSYFGDGGPDLLASLNHPEGLVIDPTGVVYIADTLNNAIRRRDVNGLMSTIAGTGVAGLGGDGGLAGSAQLNAPAAIALDSAGNLYIADSGNQSIREIAQGGAISTIATGISGANSVAVDAAGAVYAGDSVARVVFRIPPGGGPMAIAGTGNCCYSGDGGPAVNAALDTPWGLAVDPSGNVYIADREANAVRELQLVSQ
jgi:trimeric autotransporter adhesin